MPPFQEPVSAYFRDWQDTAVHRASGTEILGYLADEEVDSGGGYEPTVRTRREYHFECPRADWDAAGIHTQDVLEIRGRTFIVVAQPRDDDVAEVPLRCARG